MPVPTITDVQAVDPVLSGLAVGYMQADNRFVATRVFPPVPVDKDSGTYYTFTKKYFMVDEMEERAPGQEFPRVGFGLSTSTYTTLQWALSFPLADEVRANSQVPMDLEEAGLRLLAQRSLIRKERAFAADFMTTSVWGTDDNNSTTDWDDFSAGDPVTDVLTAIRTISMNTGQTANTIVVGHIVHNALINHPDIIDRVKYTQQATIGNMEGAIAAALGLANYWPSMASYNTANLGQDFSGSAIIDDDALICWVDHSAGVFSATAGKTFVWAPGGGLGGVRPYRSEDTDSDVFKYKEQWDQVAVATDVGYFFADVV